VIDLAALADEVVSQLGVLAEEKHQSLTIERSGTGRGIGDRVVLRQALINLVDNAIKYTPDGGRIRIRISDAADGRAVDVIDSGPGVAPEAATRIFDRFDRGPQAGPDASGSGLGLAIAKWAVEVSGGSLSLESVEGRGSTFRIALPAPQEQRG
jgi:signal transduction histidine kinase